MKKDFVTLKPKETYLLCKGFCLKAHLPSATFAFECSSFSISIHAETISTYFQNIPSSTTNISGSIRTELWSFLKFLKLSILINRKQIVEIPNYLNKLRNMLKLSMKLDFHFLDSFEKQNKSFIECRIDIVFCSI